MSRIELIAAGSACDVSLWEVVFTEKLCCNTPGMDSQFWRKSQILHKETWMGNSWVGVSLKSVDFHSFMVQRLNWTAYDFLITTKLHLMQYRSDIKLDFPYNF